MSSPASPPTQALRVIRPAASDTDGEQKRHSGHRPQNHHHSGKTALSLLLSPPGVSTRSGGSPKHSPWWNSSPEGCPLPCPTTQDQTQAADLGEIQMHALAPATCSLILRTVLWSREMIPVLTPQPTHPTNWPIPSPEVWLQSWNPNKPSTQWPARADWTELGDVGWWLGMWGGDPPHQCPPPHERCVTGRGRSWCLPSW